jgi:hypothetical protein
MLMQQPQLHRSLLDYLPLWGLFAVTLAIVLLSFEGGFRVGFWKSRWAKQEQDEVARTMAVAMLGLLSLMLAFTFGMAVSRFDVRRQALIDEINAIRTTYMRADLLPEPYREEIRNLLRGYVDDRLEGMRLGQVELSHVRAAEWHARLWSETIAAEEKASRPASIGYFIQSLNEMISLSVERVMISHWFRIPGIIWFALYTITALASAAVGYHSGLSRSSRSFVVPAFAVIFSAVLILVLDIDRPREWTHKASQEAFVNIHNMMVAPKR